MSPLLKELKMWWNAKPTRPSQYRRNKDVEWSFEKKSVQQLFLLKRRKYFWFCHCFTTPIGTLQLWWQSGEHDRDSLFSGVNNEKIQVFSVWKRSDIKKRLLKSHYRLKQLLNTWLICNQLLLRLLQRLDQFQKSVLHLIHYPRVSVIVVVETTNQLKQNTWESLKPHFKPISK